MTIEKYTMGIGDRFGHQGEAQLGALEKANRFGVSVIPVWNKSFREHSIIGTTPADTRIEADAAVKALGWGKSYYVDADHIGIKNVDGFMEHSDFFTLDVADYIGEPADDRDIQAFIRANEKYIGELRIPAIDSVFQVTRQDLVQIGGIFLGAVKEAGRIYRHIVKNKKTPFVTEVSMDESERPQTPMEMFFILSAIASEGIPAQTIAPKFSGRFNKGVDYVGDVEQFSKEFEQDLAVIQFAIQEFGLPESLKLSVHSGSDKFSIYGPIHRAIQKFDAGLHLKTAGTTWLEELIGLAVAGGDGLKIAKDVYTASLKKFDELCKPYATVIDIDPAKLPAVETANNWDGDTFTRTLRHNLSDPVYNLHFRQLLHVGYKVAAQMGDRFTDALKKNKAVIAENVTENIFERHVKPIFVGNG
ncbi:hypothetical protein JW935_25870 [candidate division KSB1 bacterium]|nr:hypothetical protein [candidate division KSB1 bacterium]